MGLTVMSEVLNAKQRQALDRMTLDHSNFHIGAELGPGVGTKTVESLLALGLIEASPNARHYGQIGWRLTNDGWRCMYGETIAEILAKPDGVKTFPFVVWKWPVDPDGKRRRF
jgi:hypothetical protein